jgi:hypothetical protein
VAQDTVETFGVYKSGVAMDGSPTNATTDAYVENATSSATGDKISDSLGIIAYSDDSDSGKGKFVIVSSIDEPI